MYQLTESGVKRLDDNAWIPNNPDNLDWQEYQLWLQEEGNEPLPAPVEVSEAAIANGHARQERLRQEEAAALEERVATLEQQLKTGN